MKVLARLSLGLMAAAGVAVLVAVFVRPAPPIEDCVVGSGRVTIEVYGPGAGGWCDAPARLVGSWQRLELEGPPDGLVSCQLTAGDLVLTVRDAAILGLGTGPRVCSALVGGPL